MAQPCEMCEIGWKCVRVLPPRFRQRPDMLAASRLVQSERRDWMSYHFRLQRTDGAPADPPTYRSLVLAWRQGDTIPLGNDRSLRVLGTRGDDADQPPVLVVEDMPESGSSAAA